MGNDRVPYKTILAAKTGNAEAMVEILRHYEDYINFYSRRTLYDENGEPVTIIDEEIKERIQAKLMYRILYDFDPYRRPREE